MTCRRGWEQLHEERFHKNLVRPLPVQDRKDKDSGYLLSRALVHVDAQDGEATMVVQQRRWKNLIDYFRVFQTYEVLV
jgi:hypothetical protein